MISMFKAIHYCYQMHFRTLEICVLKYTNWISMARSFKKS